jgi:hypothetical protein
VWIGLISYPLYLFHWPALSFVHIVKGENPKLGYVITAVAVSFLLATLTYYLIEKKIRHHKSRWTLPILVTLFILTGIAGWLISCRVIPAREISPEMQKIQNAIADRNTMQGLIPLPSGKTHVAYYKTGGNGPQTLFVGDSNAQQYAPRIFKLLKSNKEEDRGCFFITAGAVPPIPNVINNEKPGCLVLMKIFDDILVSNPKIDRIIFAGLWHGYFLPKSLYHYKGEAMSTPSGQKVSIAELGSKIKKLKESGKAVTIVMSIPTGNELDPKNFFCRNFIGVQRVSNKILKKEIFLKQNGAILSRIASTARENGAEVIDPMDYLCTNGVCISENEDGPICLDAYHLRPGYVRDHVKYLDQTVAP